jgi:hypothetical protein
MKTASLQTPFAYNLMNGDECYESMRSEVVSRRDRRGDSRRLTTPCGEDRCCFSFQRKPLEEMGASYILMNAGTSRSCKILLSKNGALCFFTSVLPSKAAQAFGSLLRRYAPVSKGSRAAYDMTGFPNDRPSVISRELRGPLRDYWSPRQDESMPHRMVSCLLPVVYRLLSR